MFHFQHYALCLTPYALRLEPYALSLLRLEPYALRLKHIEPYLYKMESAVCVCGAGTMGRGISLAIAGKGIPVILYDLDAGMISGAAGLIHQELEQEFEKKRISTDEKKTLFNLIRFTSSISPIVMLR